MNASLINGDEVAMLFYLLNVKFKLTQLTILYICISKKNREAKMYKCKIEK